MTIEETGKIVDKIRIFRQGFAGYTDKAGLFKLKIEWHKVLEPYDYLDVDKELDKYFKNGDNYGKYPDVYYLTKYLTKITDKSKQGENYINCPICHKKILLCDLQIHHERCSSINYLIKMSKKYFNKNLSYEKLEDTDEETFNKFYWNFQESLLKIIEDGVVKKSLENSINAHYGRKINTNINEVIGMVK